MKTIRFHALLITACLSFSIATAAASQKQYTLKGDAPTGTLIKTTDLTSSLPLNKRYFQLDDTEKSIYRSKYQSLSSSVIPPFPSKGLGSIYQPIVQEHKKSARKGTLLVTAVVDKNGQVESLSVHKSPSRHLAKASAAVLRNTQFDPAFCAGEPCKMEFPLRVEFH